VKSPRHWSARAWSVQGRVTTFCMVLLVFWATVDFGVFAGLACFVNGMLGISTMGASQLESAVREIETIERLQARRLERRG
jgi:hypothetical protein